MAKKLLTTYTFTPGAENAGSLVVPGTYTLEQFLLVTNVTRGTVLYQFNVPAKGGTVAASGGNTTLFFETYTQSMSSGDRLQVYVDDGADLVVSVGEVEVKNDTGNPVSVSAASLPLPSGAATAANQAATNSSLGSIDNKLPTLNGGRIPVDVGGATLNISGDVIVSNEVEVKNDTGNPIPAVVTALPEGEAALRDLLDMLQALLGRVGYADPTGNYRVSVQNSPAVTVSSGTVTTVSTVTALTTLTNIGSFNATMQQPAIMVSAVASAIRAQISVT